VVKSRCANVVFLAVSDLGPNFQTHCPPDQSRVDHHLVVPFCYHVQTAPLAVGRKFKDEAVREIKLGVEEELAVLALAVAREEVQTVTPS
jgi:hypothetical protein